MLDVFASVWPMVSNMLRMHYDTLGSRCVVLYLDILAI